MNIFIVIPSYNEKKHIALVVKGIKKYNKNIVVVDDGSEDDTGQIAQKAGAKYVLRHKINQGKSKGAAMKTGAVFAFENGADAVLFMDSDGQHSPKDYLKFAEKLKKGFDVVLGARIAGLKIPFVRLLGNKFASVLVTLLFGIYVSDVLCGYRALTKKAFKKLFWDSIGYGVETEMIVRLSKSGLKYCEVPVETIYLDKVKGVTILDSVGIFFEVIGWRIKL